MNPNPRKPGEFILRKRKKPIEYEIDENTLIDSIPSKTPSQLLTEPKKSMIGGGAVLNTLAGTEFFSMQSTLNANLQRELDALLSSILSSEKNEPNEKHKSKHHDLVIQPFRSVVLKKNLKMRMLMNMSMNMNTLMNH